MGLLTAMCNDCETFVRTENITDWQITPIGKEYQIIFDVGEKHYWLRRRYTTYDVAKSQLQQLVYRLDTGLKVCDYANEQTVCSEMTDYDKQRKTK